MSYLRKLVLDLFEGLLGGVAVVAAVAAVLLLWFHWGVRGPAFFVSLVTALLIVALATRFAARAARLLLGGDGRSQ